MDGCCTLQLPCSPQPFYDFPVLCNLCWNECFRILLSDDNNSQTLTYMFTILLIQQQFIFFVLAVITFLGIWNLDFFWYVIPSFCISSDTSTLHMVALVYVVAIYPLVLTVIIYFCIEMHDGSQGDHFFCGGHSICVLLISEGGGIPKDLWSMLLLLSCCCHIQSCWQYPTVCWLLVTYTTT